jgi:hypothetical protein
MKSSSIVRKNSKGLAIAVTCCKKYFVNPQGTLVPQGRRHGYPYTLPSPNNFLVIFKFSSAIGNKLGGK